MRSLEELVFSNRRGAFRLLFEVRTQALHGPIDEGLGPPHLFEKLRNSSTAATCEAVPQAGAAVNAKRRARAAWLFSVKRAEADPVAVSPLSKSGYVLIVESENGSFGA